MRPVLTPQGLRFTDAAGDAASAGTGASILGLLFVGVAALAVFGGANVLTAREPRRSILETDRR